MSGQAKYFFIPLNEQAKQNKINQLKEEEEEEEEEEKEEEEEEEQQQQQQQQQHQQQQRQRQQQRKNMCPCINNLTFYRAQQQAGNIDI